MIIYRQMSDSLSVKRIGSWSKRIKFGGAYLEALKVNKTEW